MKKLLYFDMEWVPISKDFKTLEKEYPLHAEAWSRKCEKWRKDGKFVDETDEEIYEKEAGFFPEFIKIICISIGYYKQNKQNENQQEFVVDSIYGNDEKMIVEKMHELLSKTAGKYKLCGHGIKRYDMPFLAKRMAFHNLTIPYDLNNGMKKPWEIDVVDISELWSFGCNAEKYTPLDWICVSLGIPTSKSDFSGGDVKKIYYEENRLEDIVKYCEKDVEVTAKIEQKLNKLINPSIFE